MAYGQDVGHTQHSQTDQSRAGTNLDLLAERMEKGQKNAESHRDGKQESAIQILSSPRGW